MKYFNLSTTFRMCHKLVPPARVSKCNTALHHMVLFVITQAGARRLELQLWDRILVHVTVFVGFVVGAVRDILGHFFQSYKSWHRYKKILYSFDIRWMPRQESRRSDVLAKSKMVSIQMCDIPYQRYIKGCEHGIYRYLL